MKKNLEFKGGNPGAVQHGNFINYYDFHPPEERIKLLPKHVWKVADGESFVALDIGCNAGNLTLSLHTFLKETIEGNVSMLGVDIDPSLIERADEQNRSTNVSFKCLDVMDDVARSRTITDYLTGKNKTKFDVVFCFSTTMWIHLNNGDDGLERFLMHLCSVARMVIIEPQPWKCYRAALKRVKGTEAGFPLYETLKIRKNIEYGIEGIILELGARKVWESEKNSWDRKLLCFEIF